MDIHEIRRHNARLLAEKNKTLSSFAEVIGRPPTQVSRFMGKNPTRSIGSKIAREIEHAFNKPHGWLDIYHDTAHDSRQLKTDGNLLVSGYDIEGTRSIPVISWVQAGDFSDSGGLYAPVDDTTEYTAYHGRISNGAYALIVQGDSMVSPYPGQMSFLPGSRVVIDPALEAQPGQYVVVRLPGTDDVTLKQLVRDSGQLFLKPLNPQYTTMPFPKDGHICGVVVSINTKLS